jgi:hypothetical protein
MAKNKQLKFDFDLISLFAIFTLTCITLFAAFSNRPIYSEGAHWYYLILNSGEVLNDPRFIRHFNYILQYPAVLLLKTFGNGVSQQILATYTLSFFWHITPLVSLIYCYWLLRKKNNLSLMIFPILGVFCSVLPALPYAVALAIPSGSIFFCALLTFLHLKGVDYKDYVIAAAWLLLLSICYEPGAIFFGLIASYHAYDLLLKKDKNKIYSIFVITLCLVAGYILVSSILTDNEQQSNSFLQSLSSSLDGVRIFSFLSGLLLLGILKIQFFEGHNKKYFKYFSNFLFFLFFLISILFSIQIFSYLAFINWQSKIIYFSDISDSFNSRASIVFVNSILGILTIYYFTKQQSINISKKVFLSLTIIISLMAVNDVIRTLHFRDVFNNRLGGILRQQTGCVNLDQENYTKIFQWNRVVENYSLQYSTIMWQLLNNYQEIKTILVTTSPLNGQVEKNRNACEDIKSFVLVNNQNFDFNLNVGNIKFSAELKQLSKDYK